MAAKLTFTSPSVLEVIMPSLTDQELMRVASTCRVAFTVVTRNEQEWTRRAKKQEKVLQPNAPLSLFEQYIASRPESRIASAYRRGVERANWFFQSDFRRHPMILPGPDDEMPIPVSSSKAGVFYLMAGLAGGCVIFSPTPEAPLLLRVMGVCVLPVIIGSGLLFLVPDAPASRKLAGHVMVLKEKAMMAFERCRRPVKHD